MAESTIIERYAPLKWAQNNNSIGVRSVNLGTWTVVRVGMLCSVRQDVQGDIAPNFAFGLCSGTTAVYGDASVTHFVGVTATGAGDWTINAATWLIDQAVFPMKKVGVTQTAGIIDLCSGQHIINAVTTNNYRSVFFVEFTKGSPDYSFRLFHRNQNVAGDYTVTDLTTVMESGAPALSLHAMGAAQVLAVDEGVDGTLDAAQFYWNLTTSSLEIDAIMVSKIS